MLLIRGHAGGTTLTGTLYERGERPPTYRGAPDDGAPYVWVCDSFYEVESGGQVQTINDEERRVAFEAPSPHGFETREQAIRDAYDHIRTQFARLGLPSSDVDFELSKVHPET
ncbi:hypothetical protein [Haladaptatus sp. DJG-WS-42]|uniref:DUF7113 family protein n=1 Tax=Haladaptatus sp. DJG-WS-42 TaxID=3120516 RepID=UPI0030D0B58E